MGSMDQVVELQKTLPKLLKDMERLVKTSGGLFDESEIKKVKAINDEFERLRSGMERAGQKGAVGFGRELQKISQALSASLSQQKELVAQRMEVEKKRGKRALYYEDRRLNTALKGIRELEAEQAKNAARALKDLKKFEMAQTRLNNNMTGTIFDPKVNPFNKDALTDVDQFAEYTEEKLSSLADTFSDALSGNLDQLVSRGFALTKGSLKALDMKGAKLQAKGQQEGGGGMFSTFGMGKALSKLALGLKVITGAAAGVFAIFKGMQALEENLKGIHKELIDSYGATDLMADGMTNVKDSVNTIREGLARASFANTLGVTLEEARQLAYTFNEVGINFGSLQDEGMTLERSISKIKELTVQFQASAKALGVDFGTLVSFSGEFRKELGISVKDGAYLERMSQEFGRIRDLSKQSTLNTKDFFGVIQDLSQGIGSMNIRIGEAANLFANLSKVLGPEAAQAFTKGLAGGFKGEGIQERFKRIILTGGMKGAFKRTAEQTKKDFFELFKSRKTQKLLSEIGVDRDTDFSKMSDAELERKMGQLRRRGGAEGQGAARKLMQSVRLARAGKGGLSNQALALGDLDMSGALSAQFKQLYNVTGGKGFKDVTAIEMEKISQMTGKSLDELEQMRMLDMAMRDDFRVLEDIKANTRGADGRIDEAKARAELEKAGLSDKLLVQNGKIVDKQGRQVDNIQDYIHSQGAELDAQNINTVTQLDLLNDIVVATMTSADIINNHLGEILQSIAGPVVSMLGILSLDSGEDRKKQQERAKELRSESSAQREEANRLKAEEVRKARDNKLRISKIKDPAKRKAEAEKEEKRRASVQKEIESLLVQSEVTMERSRLYAEYHESIRGGAGGGDAGAQFGEAYKSMTSSGKDRGALAELVKTKGSEQVVSSLLASQGFSSGDVHKYFTDFKSLDAGKAKDIAKFLTSYGLERTDSSDTTTGLEFQNLSGLSESQRRLSLGESGVSGRGYESYAKLMARGSSKENVEKYKSYRAQKDKINVEISRLDEELRALPEIYTEEQKEKLRESIRKSFMEEGKTGDDLEKAVSKELDLLTSEGDKLSPAERDKIEQNRAEIIAEKQAKSKQLKEMHSEAVLEALEKRDKKQLETEMRAHLSKTEDFSLESSGNRITAISHLDSKLRDENLSDEQRDHFHALRQKFRMYYGEDAVSASGMTKPMLFHNGYLMEGRRDDSVAFFNPNAPNAGRGGMGGSTIINNYNINGNNPSAMLETLKRANQSQGMLMG